MVKIKGKATDGKININKCLINKDKEFGVIKIKVVAAVIAGEGEDGVEEAEMAVTEVVWM